MVLCVCHLHCACFFSFGKGARSSLYEHFFTLGVSKNKTDPGTSRTPWPQNVNKG